MADIELVSGFKMPLLGLGTWNLEGSACEETVRKALNLGYRHIDTAHMYGNQRAVGAGLRSSGVKRDEVFVTPKIWRDSLAYDKVHRQFDACLEMLAMDYVDLLLIHWPDASVPLAETLKAFDEIAASGRAQSIGVSNFSAAQVKAAKDLASAPIVNNQVELHVGHFDAEFLAHTQQQGVSVTAHRPLAKGELATSRTLEKIGTRHGKSAAQVALRWLVQKEVIAIPKASSESHLRANMEIFDWALDRDEMNRLDRD